MGCPRYPGKDLGPPRWPPEHGVPAEPGEHMRCLGDPGVPSRAMGCPAGFSGCPVPDMLLFTKHWLLFLLRFPSSHLRERGAGTGWEGARGFPLPPPNFQQPPQNPPRAPFSAGQSPPGVPNAAMSQVGSGPGVWDGELGEP